MKITLCGSIAFHDEMSELKTKLVALGHEVDLPPDEVPNENGVMIPVKQYYEIRKLAEKEKGSDDSWIWNQKEAAMRNHFAKVTWADVILVTNYTKKDIENYIGANTLLEMGLAFHLNKKIYLLNSIPEISYKEEVLGMKPIVIDNDLKKII
jgi:hypothetical protein